jgi:glutamate decarboxylase
VARKENGRGKGHVKAEHYHGFEVSRLIDPMFFIKSTKNAHSAQVALEKFARYFEVEARVLPVSEKSRYRLDPELVRENIDENTIGVFVILGSTYTGHYEPVQEISDILDEYEKNTGVDIPIHVDGASGAFIAPFTHAKVNKCQSFQSI